VRRRPVAATVDRAAEAEAQVMFFAECYEPAARFAQVVRRVQCAATIRAAGGTAGLGTVTVEIEDPFMEFGICKQCLVQGRRPSRQHR
jgi:hypothetical protein